MQDFIFDDVLKEYFRNLIFYWTKVWFKFYNMHKEDLFSFLNSQLYCIAKEIFFSTVQKHPLKLYTNDSILVF